MQNNLQNKNQMHPSDMRNLIIFAVCSVLLWTAYEVFVLQPSREAVQKQAVIEKQIAQKKALGQIPDIPEFRPRDEVLNENLRLPFKSKSLTGTLSLKGGRVDDVTLNEYFQTLEEKKNVVLLSPGGTEHARYLEHGWVAADKNITVPGPDTLWRVQGPQELSPGSPLTLVWENGQGLRFERTITMDDDYMLTVRQSVTNNSGQSVTLFPYALISQQGLPENMQATFILHEGPIGWIGKELKELSYNSFKEDPRLEFQADHGWIGITEKYWLTALIPAQGQDTKYRFTNIPSSAGKDRGRYQTDYLGPPAVIAAGERAENTSHAFIGAKKVKTLQDYQKNLNIPNFDLAVDFGWFWFMTKPFYHVLHFFYEWVGNFGVAIILLTLVIRTAVFPLTNTSYKSFAKMKKVTPQMTKLREECGDDKAELQKRIIDLYQKEGVNPMAGCFPIILQIPIFFALYKTLFVTIEMRHAPFFGWIDDLSAPDPTSFANIFGLLPFDPPSFLHVGIWPCLMLIIMLVQKQLNPPPQDKIQRDMMTVFPFAITYILSRFASGLVIYWTFSALISVIQQMIIMHRLGVPIHLLGQTEEEKKLEQAVNKGPAIHPLAEMAEDEVEEAIFGDEEEEKPKQITPAKPKRKKKK